MTTYEFAKRAADRGAPEKLIDSIWFTALSLSFGFATIVALLCAFTLAIDFDLLTPPTHLCLYFAAAD